MGVVPKNSDSVTSSIIVMNEPKTLHDARSGIHFRG